MPNKKEVSAESKTVGVTIEVDEKTHHKVLMKQINKFRKKKTVAEVCALAVAKGIDKL